MRGRSSSQRAARLGKTFGTTGALVRFHAAVGMSVSLRLFAPQIGLLMVLAGFLGPGPLIGLARAGLFDSGALVRGGLAGAMLSLAAGFTMRRLEASAAGWMRHLPLTEARHRHGLVVAGWLALTPVVVVLAVLAAVSAPSPEAGALALPLAGLLFAAVPATYGALRCRPRALVAGAGWSGALAASTGTAPALVVALAATLVAELGAGRLVCPRPRAEPADPRTLPGPWALAARTAWRAVGLRALRAIALGVLPVAAAWLFLRNNDAEAARTAAAIGAGVFGATFSIAAVAELLAARRPAWPWFRSLPWSARRRVTADAVVLAAAALPVVVATGFVSVTAIAHVLAAVPALAVTAGGCLRLHAEARLGPSIPVLVLGIMLAAAMALLPGAAWVVLAGAAPALLWATARERRFKVTRWVELQQAVAGDSQMPESVE